MLAFADDAPKVAGTVITLTVISAIVYPMRIYTRSRNAIWGADDWCMTVAAVPFTALSVFCLGGSFQGIGVHQRRLSAEQERVGLMWFFCFEIFYCITIVPIKLSISFMLMRIATPRRGYINSLYAISALFTVMNAISLFYIIFQCQPVKAAWTGEGHCNPSKILADIYYADTSINIVTDWFCALLPIPLLWNVQLNRNAKLTVAFLLSLGALASLSACIRLHYTVLLNRSEDQLYSVGNIVIWGYAENGVGFIVGCISTLRPLFRKMFHLGSTEDPSSKFNTGPSRRAYQEFESGYEMPVTRPDKVKAIATIKGGQSRRSSSLSGSESEEYLVADSGGIQISRSVLQHVE